jgi:hypothetical protein
MCIFGYLEFLHGPDGIFFLLLEVGVFLLHSRIGEMHEAF